MDLKKIVDIIKKKVLVGVCEDTPVGLHEPLFAGNEEAYVGECIRTGWVSSVGKFVDRFENELAAYTGARRAVAMVNGTSALHVGMLISGVGPGDEVLMPALTFVATANAVSYTGATPHFVDISQETFGLDPAPLDEHLARCAEKKAGELVNKETGRTIKAVIPMHTFGEPVRMDALLEVADKYGLLVVEDAAESLGSFYQGRHTGTFGKCGILSFNGNKIITTGGGGALLTDDDELADRAKHLSTTAKVPHAYKFVHDMVGYNYRMPNINAALGCAQLEELGTLLQLKKDLFNSYQRELSSVEGVHVFSGAPDSRSNHWLNTLVLQSARAHERDALIEQLNIAGLGSRPCWTLMHELPMYQHHPRAELQVCEDLVARSLNVPSSAFLGAPRSASAHSSSDGPASRTSTPDRDLS